MRATTKRITILLISVAAIAAAAIGGFIWRAHTDRRSMPGHIVRYIRGESGAAQRLNDIAEDIRSVPSLSQLQSWSLETLRRFHDGQVQTNGPPSFWWEDRKAIRLAQSERPEFIRHQWGVTNSWGDEEPELYVVLGTSGRPEVFAVAWYSHGIEIGPPDYQMPGELSYFNFYVKAKPGVFVYANYK
jgi:hypothetical protein